MKYVQPYGLTDPDSSYVNGNPAIGLTGFVPPAESVEPKLRELAACIFGSGFALDATDLEQFTKSVRSQYLNYFVDEGTTNALVITSQRLPITELTRGLPLRVLVARDNTGPSTIVVDGIGPIFILRANGSNLGDGDLRSGEIAELVYDGSYFQITNFMGYSADNETNNFYNFDIPYCVDTSVSANLLNAPFSPIITGLFAGLTIEVKIANANTGATQIIVNSLPSQPVRIPSGSTKTFHELEPGQLAIGMIALMIYDGIQFQLINPAKPQLASQISLPVQVVKMAIIEDPNKHSVTLASFPEGGWGALEGQPISSLYPIEAPVFEFDYAPVSAGNKLRIEVSGSLGFLTNCGHPPPCVMVYLAFKYGDQGYNPAAFPGLDYPNTGSFAVNTGVLFLQRQPIAPFAPFSPSRFQNPNLYYYVNPYSMDMQFKMLGQLVIPAGPPNPLHFRMSITAFPSYMVEKKGKDIMDHTIHGGTIYQLTEYTP